MNMAGSVLETPSKCWAFRIHSNFKGDITETGNVI
jgi:hypothetical protein